MANKETTRMIKLGEWLENYLNPEIKPTGYRKLGNNFIELCGIDYVITPKDLTLSFLNLIEQQPENIQEYYKKDIYLKESPLGIFFGREDPLKIFLFLKNEVEKYFKEFDLNDPLLAGDLIEQAVYTIFNIFYSRIKAVQLFQLLLNSKTCWQHALFEKAKTEIEEITYKECRMINRFPGKSNIVESFMENYNKIQTIINKDFVSEKLIFRKHFSFEEKIITEKKILSNPNFEIPSCFPWDIALSYAIFEFLKFGGQDHIHFCNQCGRFTVIKRKNRKEYCSSLCRIRASNERIAQAGA